MLTAGRWFPERKSTKWFAKWRRGRALIIGVTPIMFRVAKVVAATLPTVVMALATVAMAHAHSVVMVMVVVVVFIVGVRIGVGVRVGVRRIRVRIGMVTLSSAVYALAKLPSPLVFVHFFGNSSPLEASRTTHVPPSSVRRSRMGH